MSRARSPLAADLMARLDGIEAAGRARSYGSIPLITFATHPDFCGLALSPAQAAILEASQAQPTSCPRDLALRLFNCVPESLPQKKPRAIVVTGGGRGGKTGRLLASACLHAAWTCPLTPNKGRPPEGFPAAQQLDAGEMPRALIISAKKKLAKKTFAAVKGLVEQSTVLRAAVVGEMTASEIYLMRPDGIIVEIMIGVASGGGVDARSASLVFFGLDEAAFLHGEGYAANDEDLYSAAATRLVPYAQAWLVTTPWIEGEGLVERLVTTSWGSRPGAGDATHVDALVAARVGTHTLNPGFDPDGTIEAAERRRPGGAENVQRDIYGMPLAKGTKGLFPPEAIKKALERHAPSGRPEAVGAGADIAHDSDHASLVLAARWPGGIFAPTKILSDDPADGKPPSKVYEEYADACVAAAIASVAADGHYKATFREALAKRRVRLETELPPKAETYLATRTLFTEDKIALGHLPSDVREDLAEQLRSVLKKPGSGGATVIIQRRLADGNHCDDVSGLVLALWRVGSLDPKTWESKPFVARPRPATARAGYSAGRGGWGDSGDRDEWR